MDPNAQPNNTSKAAPPGVEEALPPWTMPETEAWWLLTSLSGPGANDVPPGNFDPLEELSSQEAKGGNFVGGTGMVQIVRYKDSPAGPYDELIMCPGYFKNPKGPDSLRITRIYVSTLKSVWNGRRNWNIPKHLARFSFTPSTSIKGATEVRIYTPNTISYDAAAGQDTTTWNETPFFAALLQPSRLPIPAIPFNLKYSPLRLTLIQPPLESSESVETDGLAGTDKWCSILPGFVGSIKSVSVTPLLDMPPAEASKRPKRFANGVEFPDFAPYSIGIHWPSATLTFHNPTWFE
ncbi:hypothetical protein DL93DRAFT_2085247 [Clavulina sp. PMI_390]|nr:hypothetical protein DL93DRAFT_2085247 [Clavulina sp. PMI_390]